MSVGPSGGIGARSPIPEIGGGGAGVIGGVEPSQAATAAARPARRRKGRSDIIGSRETECDPTEDRGEACPNHGGSGEFHDLLIDRRRRRPGGREAPRQCRRARRAGCFPSSSPRPPQRPPGAHGVAGLDRERDQEARHRRQQEAGQVGRRLDRHEIGERGGIGRYEREGDLRPAMAEAQPYRQAIDLRREGQAVDRAVEQRLAASGLRSWCWRRRASRSSRPRPRRPRPAGSAAPGAASSAAPGGPGRGAPPGGAARPPGPRAGAPPPDPTSRRGTRREVLGDEVGGQPPLGGTRMVHERCEERDVVADPAITKASSARRSAASQRRGPRPGDQLGNHRVVVGRDLGALLDTRHRPGCRAAPRAGGSELADRSTAGSCAAGPRRRCAPRWPSPSAARRPGRTAASRRPRCGAQLDEVEPGHRLGHRVLDLKPRVHFEEVEVAGPRRRGTRPSRRRRSRRARASATAASPIAARRSRVDERATAPPRSPSDGGAGSSIRARRDARTLPCVSPRTWISMWRGSSMYFSMKTRSSPKADAPRVGARRAARRARSSRATAHALAAAAGRRLDHHRIADVAARSRRASSASAIGAVMPGTVGTPACVRQRLRGDLVAHRLDRLGRRADEDDPGLVERAREVRRSPTESRSPDAPLPRAGLRGRPRRCGRCGDSCSRRGAGPMTTASSAISTCSASRSASE